MLTEAPLCSLSPLFLSSLLLLSTSLFPPPLPFSPPEISENCALRFPPPQHSSPLRLLELRDLKRTKNQPPLSPSLFFPKIDPFPSSLSPSFPPTSSNGHNSSAIRTHIEPADRFGSSSGGSHEVDGRRAGAGRVGEEVERRRGKASFWSSYSSTCVST